MDPDLARVEHLEPEDVERVGGPGADNLREARNPDAHELAALPFRGLLLPQRVVAD